ncbi:MAG: cadherin repeat domain-containing protein, partial [Planctomycetota bacterium]
VTISVEDVNDAPTAARLIGGTIAENSPIGTVVGQVLVQDEDAGDTHRYTLVNDADGRFEIDHRTGEVRVLRPDLLDYESSNRYDLTVRVTDVNGATLDESFTVRLTDEIETAPERPEFEETPEQREDTVDEAPNVDREIVPEDRDAAAISADSESRGANTREAADDGSDDREASLANAAIDATFEAERLASEVLRFDPRSLTFEAELLEDTQRLAQEAQELADLAGEAAFADAFVVEDQGDLRDVSSTPTETSDSDVEANEFDPEQEPTDRTAEAAQYSAGLWMMLRKAVGLGLREDVPPPITSPRDERKQAPKRR